jgi:hypothetical protein
MTTSITRIALLILVCLSFFSAYGEEKQQEHLPAHPAEQNKENPRDGFDTLQFYLGKSGSVVSGTFSSSIEGGASMSLRTSYTGTFHIKDTLYGPKPAKQDIELNLGVFAGNNHPPEFIKDGSECIVFLEHKPEGKDENVWNTIDIWSGVHPYSRQLELAIKRVAKKDNFLKPSKRSPSP